MKIQWQKPLIDKRMIVVLLLEVLLLISSLALYFDQQNSKLLQQVHDPVMTVFIGAMPDRFASSQLWWLLLWVGFMSLPIFICAGVTDAYQRNLYTFFSLRMHRRLGAYIWPLKQVVLREASLLLVMGIAVGTLTHFFLRTQQFGEAGLFIILIIVSQTFLVVLEAVLEGYFGPMIGVVGTLTIIFLSFLQMPLMPLRFAIGSTFATDPQLLGATGYQIALIILLLLIQLFYMPGRWGQYGTGRE
ncbi:hypothetical protein [Lacticaseibacillus rhamnosus]|uniref:hypothetical protein n=1 Tax=Lacticaseibacillus rhamnosus TaxID=47715 RepID=UPI000532DAFE|nr:hypothetical protein [Lacticaseibacillus rhamnosus]